MPLPARVKYVRKNLAAINPRARKPWMSQPEFADAVGVSDRTIVSKWEREDGGTTPRNFAPKIAALTPYPAEAFGGDGEAELVRSSLGTRLEVIEDALNELGPDLAALASLPARVALLEKRDQPRKRQAGPVKQ